MTEGVGVKPVEVDYEIEDDFTLASLVYHVHNLTTKISEMETSENAKGGTYLPT